VWPSRSFAFPLLPSPLSPSGEMEAKTIWVPAGKRHNCSGAGSYHLILPLSPPLLPTGEGEQGNMGQNGICISNTTMLRIVLSPLAFLLLFFLSEKEERTVAGAWTSPTAQSAPSPPAGCPSPSPPLSPSLLSLPSPLPCLRFKVEQNNSKFGETRDGIQEGRANLTYPHRFVSSFLPILLSLFFHV